MSHVCKFRRSFLKSGWGVAGVVLVKGTGCLGLHIAGLLAFRASTLSVCGCLVCVVRVSTLGLLLFEFVALWRLALLKVQDRDVRAFAVFRVRICTVCGLIRIHDLQAYKMFLGHPTVDDI